MFVVASHQAETGRRKQKIAQLMGRVLAHGVDPEPPHPDDFDISKMMEDKKRYVEERGGGVLKFDQQPQENQVAEIAANDDQGEEDDEN